VPHGQLVLGPQLGLKHVAKRARQHRHDAGGGIDGADAGQAAHVEGHAAQQGNRCAEHAGAAAGDGDRHAIRGAGVDDRHHAIDVGGPGHSAGEGRHLALGGPHQADRPPVA
jgi:hypothetical protein